jgi:hypothetical protein
MRETIVERSTTHGMSGTRVHRIWKGMLTRCLNPRTKCYSRYGGRGIKVCARWRNFENFYADMGDPPSEQHSIDRINNDGDYEPSNSRWATGSEQTRHTRRSHYLTLNGEKLPLVAWCERYRQPYQLVKDRLRWGWDPLEALTKPARPRKHA